CFLVADEIRVLTRADGHPTVSWTGFADGRYAVTIPDEQRPEVGTTVTLVPRRGTEMWLTAATVDGLARLFGSMPPINVTGDGTPTTDGGAPWEASDRRRALIAYARQTLNIDPFDVIDLHVPEAGLVGAAFVLPVPANPAQRAGHRVYLKKMLLSESADSLLP